MQLISISVRLSSWRGKGNREGRERMEIEKRKEDVRGVY